MMKKVVKLRYAIIIYILVFIFSTGATFALSEWASGNTLLSGGTMCFDVEYSTGEEIDMSGMTASLEFTEGSSASTTLSFSRKTNCELYGKGTITANVTTNSEVNLSSGGLKYRVIKNNETEPVATGSVSKSGENVIYDDFYILDMVDTYTVYFWLDANNIDNTYLEASFSGTVGSSAVSTPNYPGHIDEDVPVTNELLANFYYYDDTEEKVDYITETCVGTGDTCVITIPEEVTSTNGEYGNSYVGVSTSTGNMTYAGTDKVEFSENTSFYTLYSTEVNYKYYDTEWKEESVYRNSYINSSNELVTVLADTETSTEAITTSSSSNATLLGYSNTESGTVSHESISDITNSNSTSMTEVYQLVVNYTKGDGVSSIGKTTDSCNFTSPSTTCSVTTPSISVNEGYKALGWYDTNNKKVADQNTGLTISTNNVTYTAKASDSSVPVCLINTTSTLKSGSQTATLNCTDNLGITKYYFGTDSNGTPNTEIDSTTSMSITKTIDASGTYYLIAQDTTGNTSEVVSQIYYSYTVDNYLLNVEGTKNTYTTNNYTKVNSNTYIAPKDTTITFANVYTTPTGGEYVAASIGAASTTAPTTVTSATLTANATYTMWFNRLEYTITVATTTGGSNKVTTQNNTTGVTATSSSDSKTITIRYGEKLTATATNSTGYTFSKFSGLSTSTTNTTTVTPSKTGTITANFTANPLTFANQTITKTFSTSSQTATVTGASNGTGTYTYAEKSEKNASGTATSYISLSGTTITIAANTPAGTYTYVITATDSGSKVTKDATYTLMVNKQTVNAPTNVAVSTAGVVTWTASSNATGYQISIDNSTWTNATSGVNYLSTITASTGTRTVYVRAVNSDTTNYTTPSSNATKSVTVYAVTIKSNDTTMGTVDTVSYNVISGATYITNSNVLTIKGGSTTLKTVTATNKTGYYFGSWSSDSGTITAATTITATFTANALTFANQTITKTFSTSSQTATVTEASNGTGTYTYAEKSEKNASGTATSFISLSGTTITIAANTTAGTYTYVITATDSGSKVTKDATYTIKINKVAGSISYETKTVSKTYGDASFTNTLTKTGDGTVSYTSSNTSVATVNSSTGAVTIVGAGSTTITATVADGTNYTYATKTATYTLTVGKQTVNVPTNVAVSTAGIVTWTASSNATGYQISIDNSTWTTAISGVNYLSTITASTGIRTVYVRAVNSDTTNYSTPSSNATKSVTVYKVTIQSNNTLAGTVNNASYNVISGATYTTSNNVITLKGGTTLLGTSTATNKTGYTFSKWSSIGGTITAATTITANFTANSYTINYSLNGGTLGSNAPTTANYDGVVTVSNPTKDGWTFTGWTFNGDTSLAKYGTSSSNVTTSWSDASTFVTAEYFKNLTSTSGGTITLTAHWEKEMIGTFYYYNGSSQATKTSTCMLYDTDTLCSFTIPSGITTSTGLDDASYYGVSTSPSSTTITTTYNSNNLNYYAVYKGSWTATYNKEDTVSSIGSTSNSCTNYKTTNGTTYTSTTCSVTLPAINVDAEHIVLGWYNSSNTKVGDAGSSISLSSNITYTAKARQLAATDLYYDNTNTGVDCTDAQCMIDEINEILES